MHGHHARHASCCREALPVLAKGYVQIRALRWNRLTDLNILKCSHRKRSTHLINDFWVLKNASDIAQ